MRDLKTLANALACTDGINEWDSVGPEDFSMSFDVIVENHGSITVLDPTSRAALQWFYKHLPADCPRWGKLGFAIETNYVGDILDGMRRDGLYTEADFEQAMNHEQELQHMAAQAAEDDYHGC